MPLAWWAVASVAGLFGAGSLLSSINTVVSPPEQKENSSIFAAGNLVGLGLLAVGGVFLYRTLKGK